MAVGILSATIALSGGPRAGAGDARPSPALEAAEASQVAVTIVRGREESRFRATVIAKDKRGLTVLTAAHCLSSEDDGATLRVIRGGAAVEAKVDRVVCNPAYRPLGEAEIAGADNALAVLHVRPGDARAAEVLRDLRPAVLSSIPLPDVDGGTVSVLTIDQFAKRHVLRAANYANPKWLEWGAAYKPKEGDSGSGVFVFRKGREGQPEPLLIGTVVVRSEVGGGAALISRRARWLDEVMRR